jgi:hypothetical protein
MFIEALIIAIILHFIKTTAVETEKAIEVD